VFDVIELSSPWLTLSTPLAFQLPFQYYFFKGVALVVLLMTDIWKIDALHAIEKFMFHFNILKKTACTQHNQTIQVFCFHCPGGAPV
jgi:hypothetical protein